MKPSCGYNTGAEAGDSLQGCSPTAGTRDSHESTADMALT